MYFADRFFFFFFFFFFFLVVVVVFNRFQVYTYSIPGGFAQGAKHPLLDYLSKSLIETWKFFAYIRRNS